MGRKPTGTPGSQGKRDPLAGLSAEERTKVLEARAAKRPHLQPGEVAVKVALVVIRREKYNLPPTVHLRTNSWPMAFKDLPESGAYKKAGPHWLILKRGH